MSKSHNKYKLRKNIKLNIKIFLFILYEFCWLMSLTLS
jgi:hypothetical protein